MSENIEKMVQNTIEYWRDLYNKEKEKNKGFERVIDLKNAEIKDLNQMIDEDYISKDKIRELIEKWKNKEEWDIYTTNEIVEIFEELLEE